MTMWISGFIKNREVNFHCDNCKDCQDKFDPESTYAVSDCTRHEIKNAAICYGCDHLPCRCEEIEDNIKYPWEKWTDEC